MPPRHAPRTIGLESLLTRRVRYEREKRGWTHTGLAKRMTDVGCQMNQSAVWKIENGKPRRRITVDEVAGFAEVFGCEVGDLLVDPGVAFGQDLEDFFKEVIGAVARVSKLADKADQLATALDQLRSAEAHSDDDDGVAHLMSQWDDQRDALSSSRAHLAEAMAAIVQVTLVKGALDATRDESPRHKLGQPAGRSA